MKPLLLTLILGLVFSLSFAQQTDTEGFIALFDGESLNGWTASSENPRSFKVKNGALVCKGGRAHLFYTGEVGGADFRNFELKLKVKTTKGSNSGVYFHTEYQAEGWPGEGFEAQVNSTHTDPRKTGSLYGIVNIWAPVEPKEDFAVKVARNQEVFLLQPAAPSVDEEWFDYHITVKDKRINIKVNGKTTIDWTQPDNWNKDRRIGHGTIGLQAHDPKSEVHYKDIQIKVLK
jgi:hypothetical protein